MSWLEKHKKKKLAKKKKRFLYRVIRDKENKNAFAYSMQLFIGVSIEIFRVIFKTLLVLGVSATVILLVVGVIPKYIEYKSFAVECVKNSTEEDFRVNEASVVYNSNGDIIANLYEGTNLSYLQYDNIPKDVINAFVAIEDRSFWDNSGIDFKGLVRVFYSAIKSRGTEVHGASTITQQLARNEFLSHEVSLERKGKEMLIALELTRKYSKEDIMEFYVNNICFANGIYGIEGAANAYFNKDVSELSLSQIAYLCAIPNRPSYYDPYKSPENALSRRDKILKDMYTCGYIKESDYNNAVREEIVIEKPTTLFNNYETTFAVDCAVKYLMKLDGFEFKYKFDSMDDYKAYKDRYSSEYDSMKHKLYTGGYKIYTSIDSGVCANMQGVLDEKLSFNDEVNADTGIYELQGALTCIDNSTGKVVAVVGGRTQDNNGIYSFNRAYQSYRQPGSSIKPLVVYTPAIEEGYTADTQVENIDVSEAKKPGVSAQDLHGSKMSMRKAVEQSKNGVAWKIFDSISPEYGLSFVENMNYSKICPDDYNDASALGGLTYGVTTVEQASGFATLANHGTYREPTCIVSMLDDKGNEIYKDAEEKKVYSSGSADDMVNILEGVITKGTASKLGWNNRVQAFGKTGTTNNSKDGWFCGSTSYYTIAVWVGYDTPRELDNLYGATYPGSIWKDCMSGLVEGLPDAEFVRFEDEGDKEVGYYSYLEGRDDSEVLSEGYTVADYRSDRVIGESVYNIINKIKAESDISKVEELYEEGCNIIDTIYSRKYTEEMQGYLDEAYNSKKRE